MNLDSDELHCGDCAAPACGGSNECDDGVCGDSDCPSKCVESCIEPDNDPLNCGGCAIVCATTEVCVAGLCRPFVDSGGCGGCPCPVCDPWLCCDYPGGTSRICVDAGACPLPL